MRSVSNVGIYITRLIMRHSLLDVTRLKSRSVFRNRGSEAISENKNNTGRHNFIGRSLEMFVVFIAKIEIKFYEIKIRETANDMAKYIFHLIIKLKIF